MKDRTHKILIILIFVVLSTWLFGMANAQDSVIVNDGSNLELVNHDEIRNDGLIVVEKRIIAKIDKIEKENESLIKQQEKEITNNNVMIFLIILFFLYVLSVLYALYANSLISKYNLPNSMLFLIFIPIINIIVASSKIKHAHRVANSKVMYHRV